jgi:hypothetical protein
MKLRKALKKATTAEEYDRILSNAMNAKIPINRKKDLPPRPKK